MNKEEKAKNRIGWIDISKAIGILVVLINHAELKLGAVTYLCGMFYMPIFFVLSGYTLKEKKQERLADFAKSKAKRLLIPYACFQILLAGIFTLKNIFQKKGIYEIALPMLGSLYSRNTLYANPSDVLVKIPSYKVDLMTALNAPLWFLTGLFVSLVIYKFILLCANQNEKKELAYIGISIGIGIILKYFCPVLLPWSMDTSLISVGFLHLGRWLSRKNVINYLYKRPIETLGICIIFVMMSYFNGSVNMSVREFGKSVLLYLLIGGCGTLLVILFAKGMEDYCKLLACFFKWIGRHTIGILALHLLTFAMIDYLLSQTQLSNTMLEMVAKIVLSVVILVPIDGWIQRYLPFVYGKMRRIR